MSQNFTTSRIKRYVSGCSQPVLEFDEPTGKDVRELGYPYQMNQDESVRLLAHVVSKYIVRLAKVPQSSVDQMSPADLNAAAWLVAGFFLQA
ncbi:Phage tail assembly protein [Citrobacter portucalensis]